VRGMSKETSPRKVAVALWIYCMTLLTIGLVVNLWRQFFDTDLIKVTGFVAFFVILSCIVLSVVGHVLNGYKPLFRN
jgi:hypothetical protein